MQCLVAKDVDMTSIPLVELETQFQALRRLVASKVGYACFTKLPGYWIQYYIVSRKIQSIFLGFERL